MENNQVLAMDVKVSFRKKPTRVKVSMAKDFYEKREWAKSQLVCGIDEVGRGCLAGPLVVAAVILHSNCKLKGLKDSKILTQEELKKIYPRIIENSWYSFGIVNNIDIDKFNIYNATIIAMKQAVLNLLATCPQAPSVILIDALPVSLQNTGYKDIEIQSFIKGESLSRSIAAASIIAKVKRDSLMAMYDASLPGYYFGQHKGYGTKLHQQSLSNEGTSILHRQSYLKKFGHLFETEKNEEQQTIFCGSD